MDTLDNYRSSLDFREILRILQKASTGQDNLLWQTRARGRTIIPVHHIEIDFVAREVVAYYDDKSFSLEEFLPLYVKLGYRTTVFKVEQFRVSPGAVHFAFPTKLKTMELRSYPRHSFLPEQDKVIYLKPSMAGSRDSGNELKVRVMDISYYGLGLIISEQNRSFFKNNRILWVTKLGDHHLNHPILAEVVYINNEIDPKYIDRKQKGLKVGVKLSGIFPKEFYQDFLK